VPGGGAAWWVSKWWWCVCGVGCGGQVREALYSTLESFGLFSMASRPRVGVRIRGGDGRQAIWPLVLLLV
jgi:hypothetical protein